MYLYVDEKIGWIIVQDTDIYMYSMYPPCHTIVYFVLAWTLPSWYKIALWDDYETKVFIWTTMSRPTVLGIFGTHVFKQLLVQVVTYLTFI